MMFREQLAQFMGYENSDIDGAEMAYGIENNELKSQEIGHVVAKQGCGVWRFPISISIRYPDSN